MERKGYSRKFLRVRPNVPLYGRISIVRVGMRPVMSNHASVRVIDIGAGGLRFASRLRFPAGSSVVLEISFVLERRNYCMRGFIAHRNALEAGEYEYGLCFLQPDQGLRRTLASACGWLGGFAGEAAGSVGRRIILLRRKF